VGFTNLGCSAYTTGLTWTLTTTTPPKSGTTIYVRVASRTFTGFLTSDSTYVAGP
jgi:hypothetical protein